MKIKYTSRFKRAYTKLPPSGKHFFEDKLHQFIDDWRHPSLRVKRVQGTESIWEASINMKIRFTFEWLQDEDGNDICLLRNIGDHDHCLRPPY